HVEGFQYSSANRSIAMNNGARRPPAVTGSITNDNSGMPTMENPPPNAPFMKQIRNTPANAIKTVVAVSSMAPYVMAAGPAHREAGSIAVQSVQCDRF